MIEICTHVYAGDLPQYAVFLRAQLSSLVLWKPQVRTVISVVYTSSDDLIYKVLKEFQEPLKGVLSTLSINKSNLFRRAIGRNYVGLNTHADVIWYTDVDHVFGPGCLDEAWKSWLMLCQNQCAMIYPDGLMIHADHKIGDDFWKSHTGDDQLLIRPNFSDFVRKTYRRPIGGVQIVDGNFSRKYGYLDKQKKWQTPISEKKPFPSFRDDVAFRHFCVANGGIRPVRLEGLYRLRHTATTYQCSSN